MIDEASDGSEAGRRALLAVLQSAPSEAECGRCLAQLDAYAVAQLEGAGHSDHFAWLAHHLDGCLECAAAYALIYETALADDHGRLPEPNTYPQPNLNFLQDGAAWLAALREALQITPSSLVLQFNAALTRLLLPRPGAVLTRSAESGRYGPRLLELTSGQATDAGLPFTLAVYADRQQTSNCLLEVTVQPPGQSWPDLAGYMVTVAAGTRALVAATDAWGTAVFPNMTVDELESLRLEISFGDRQAQND